MVSEAQINRRFMTMRSDIASRRLLLIVGTYLICLALAVTPRVAAAAGATQFGNQTRFLPVDKAFQLSAAWEGGKIVVQWYLMPGYYLYRSRLGFESPDASLGKPELPTGELEQDPFFGSVHIYRDALLVDVPVAKAGDSVTLEVRYQGCADAGYCYPPQKRQLKVVKSK